MGVRENWGDRRKVALFLFPAMLRYVKKIGLMPATVFIRSSELAWEGVRGLVFVKLGILRGLGGWVGGVGVRAVEYFVKGGGGGGVGAVVMLRTGGCRCCWCLNLNWVQERFAGVFRLADVLSSTLFCYGRLCPYRRCATPPSPPPPPPLRYYRLD